MKLPGSFFEKINVYIASNQLRLLRWTCIQNHTRQCDLCTLGASGTEGASCYLSRQVSRSLSSLALLAHQSCTKLISFSLTEDYSAFSFSFLFNFDFLISLILSFYSILCQILNIIVRHVNIVMFMHEAESGSIRNFVHIYWSLSNFNSVFSGEASI